MWAPWPGSRTASYLADPSGHVHYEVVQGIGSRRRSAPQARLMSLVIRGILTRQLPWGLVLIGVFLSILLEIVGVPALAFAVGVYLPLESTTPVFIGGLVRWLIDRERGTDAESDSGPGVLYSLGPHRRGFADGPRLRGPAARGVRVGSAMPSTSASTCRLSLVEGPLVGLLTFGLISWLLYRAARSDGAAKA